MELLIRIELTNNGLPTELTKRERERERERARERERGGVVEVVIY